MNWISAFTLVIWIQTAQCLIDIRDVNWIKCSNKYIHLQIGSEEKWIIHTLKNMEMFEEVLFQDVIAFMTKPQGTKVFSLLFICQI